MLTNKVALITGAARGIGKQIALRFAAEGCHIAFTDLAIDEVALATRDEILARGVTCRAYASDASDFHAAHDTLLLRMSEQQWDDVLRINLKSAFNFIQAVSPLMLRQRSGSIISMSSVVGLNGNAGQANYAASKAGIIALTKSAAKELGSRGVRANAIAPGYILTDMTAALPESVREEFVRMIPMHRGGTPEDIANAALFLGSELSSYISGQVIAVNGALYC